ncbi:DNA mismatch endonuclease Vsr [Rhizobium leguminosarum]|uniref:Very short patch repair endonuclease n=1 Tax=Rhizobium leguminosarum TaxID=384 RepID=A0AAJ1AC97_RHILE|nr:DNA mismatch endonuclease Vsr [Rhizobium leguminosarum]MBY5533814.1 DNA mismatch endonuclease Vsr [Rhizobium leguminosarum]MBY5594902.1 DNA mismatch endonuclease Vsr [Rhizobium leguminosarum]MBY5630927.1 DNA mismatch endonuclease Vsr [Rhizobium leguminosarum]MBY5652660.1 DNA mismatch endonuclease Vsr [Rhizobium leguminosarum]
MVDKLSRSDRSRLMGRVRSKDTKPEMAVRRCAHRLGYRFRLHRKDLPGNPDIVFPGKRKVIFVHGCLWHLHNCKRARIPQSNTEFWEAKLRRNAERDARAIENLQKDGWSVLVIWECEVRSDESIAEQLHGFL